MLRPYVHFLFNSLMLVSALFSTVANAADSFNILMYHHVSSKTPRSTSLTKQEFHEHLQFLQHNNYHVLPLRQALETVQQGQALPEQAVAITFDDAMISIYDNAFPLLKQFNYPFTVFVNTDPVDQGHKYAMNWDMLRELTRHGGSLGNHGKDHGYLVRKPSYNAKWLTTTLANIDYAQQRLETETGPQPKWLAYPFGEYNLALQQALKNRGYIAFGQQSGGVGPHSDWQALPRFSVTGNYAKLESLAIKLASKPLPVHYNQLGDPVLRLDQQQDNPPLLQVNLVQPLHDNSRKRLSCFIMGQAYLPQWQDELQFIVQPNRPLPAGRTRYNCTAPIWGQDNYFWFSHQWLNYQPKPNTD